MRKGYNRLLSLFISIFFVILTMLNFSFVSANESTNSSNKYGVTLSAYTKLLYVGEQYKLDVYVPKNSEVKFIGMGYISDGTISIENGIIYAMAEGKITVDIYAKNEKVAKCCVIVKSSEKKIIENVEFIPQNPKYPFGCELVSSTMALRYAGVDLSVDDFISYVDFHRYLYYDEYGVRIGYDPNVYFAGDPYTTEAWGCYAPCIYNAINRIVDPEEYAVELLYDKTLDELCVDYIDNDIPVIFWGTRNMQKTSKGATWYILESQEWFTWARYEHCLLLVGYDEEYYYFHDPELEEGNKAYLKKDVEAAYEGLGKQCVAVYKK